MSIIPREVQEKWDKEKAKNRDEFIEELIIEDLKKRQPSISPYTNHSKPKLHKVIRTCFNCKLSTVCYGFNKLKEILKDLPTNLDNDDTPMKQVDVFTALAGCCLVYEENN